MDRQKSGVILQKTFQKFYFMKNLVEIWWKCGSSDRLFENVRILHTHSHINVPGGINLHKLSNLFKRF